MCIWLSTDAYLKAHSKERDKIVGHTVAELLGTQVFEQHFKSHLDRAFAGEALTFDAWLDFAQPWQKIHAHVLLSLSG